MVKLGAVLTIVNRLMVINRGSLRIVIVITCSLSIKRLFTGRLIDLVNNLLNLVLQDAPVLLNEHALLHLCEDLGLVLAERILVTLIKAGGSHVPREALGAVV